MQINKKFEREIALKDVFFDLAYHWRSLLVAALIGAVLLGAFQYYRIESTHRAGKQTKEEKQYEIDLQEYKDSIKNTRLSIKTYNQLIKEKNDYLDQSVYMTLDSQDVWAAYKRFYIKMDQSVLDALPEGIQEDPADYVAAAYTSTLNAGLDAAEMEELLGTGKKEYIDELLSVWSDMTGNTVTIKVIGKDAETVSKQLDYFVNRLETYCEPRAQAVGAHTLTLVSEDTYSITDADLSAKQDEINQQLVEWAESLKEQREALNALEEKEEPKAPGTHVIKFAAIGFLIGAFLLAGIYTAKYILESKLRFSRELSERYSLPVFGEFVKSRARRPGKGLDKLFEKWEFSRAVTDADTVTSGISALLSERFTGKKLLLTGTVSGQRLNEFADQLSKKLGGACEIVVQGNLPTNSDAIAEVKDADAVILVEEKHQSTNKGIERAVELLSISEADVAGCIVI